MTFNPFLIFILGTIFGSFFNVCIYRIPRNQSTVSPRSQCPHCKHKIRWFENIPILSYFLLRGKCSNCRQNISIKYPFIELLTGLIFLLLYLHLPSLSHFFVAAIFTSFLIIASFIDLEHLMIPDRFTLGGFLIGVLLSIIFPVIHGYTNEPFLLMAIKSSLSSLIGAFIGTGLLLWIALIAELFIKEEAMGFGDIKLIGFIGSITGWQGALFAIFAGSIIGCLLYLPIRCFSPNRPENNPRQVPFGPSLALAALFYLFIQTYVDNYFDVAYTLFF